MLYIPLKKLIATYLLSADQSSHLFFRIYNLAVAGLEGEFGLDIMNSFSTELLDINPNKTVLIPDWCTKFSKCGVLNSRGELVTLKVNNQLSLYHSVYFSQTDRTQGLPLLPSILGGNEVITGQPYAYNTYYLNYFNGTSFNLFGLPSGTPTIGTYKIDIKNNIIQLNSNFPFSQLIFEGQGSALNPDIDDYEIPVDAAPAMDAWIRWRNMIDLPRKYSQSERKMAQRDYTVEKRKAKVRLNPANIGNMQDAERESWTLTAKA